MSRLSMGLFIVLAFLPFQANAHRSGCHRWHSCPSDRGTYICGDTGHCNYCPDNQYCTSGNLKASSTDETPAREKTDPVAVPGCASKQDCRDNHK